MSMPSERGLLESTMNISKEDKIRINVMGQVLSCPRFIFRTAPLTGGETEAREVRPASSSGWNPITEGSRFLRILGIPVSNTPWKGQALGTEGGREGREEEGPAGCRCRGLTPGLVRELEAGPSGPGLGCQYNI